MLLQADLPLNITKQVLSSIPGQDGRMAQGDRLWLTVQLTGEVAKGGFVLGCRLVRPRTIQEVKQMLQRPPSLAEAVTQLQKKVGDVLEYHFSTACLLLHAVLLQAPFGLKSNTQALHVLGACPRVVARRLMLQQQVATDSQVGCRLSSVPCSLLVTRMSSRLPPRCLCAARPL